MATKRQTLLQFLNQDIVSLLAKAPPALESESARPKVERSLRQLAPYGSAKINGELISADGKSYPVSLWDLSQSGFCVMVHQPLPLPAGQTVTLSLQDSAGPDQLRLGCLLRWSDQVAGATFAGLRLKASPTALHESFLVRYLKSPN